MYKSATQRKPHICSKARYIKIKIAINSLTFHHLLAKFFLKKSYC